MSLVSSVLLSPSTSISVVSTNASSDVLSVFDFRYKDRLGRLHVPGMWLLQICFSLINELSNTE